ncbi:glycosyltransferase family protein [Furfurilactobacillus cerevisiae]|uniref:hypothetical protein n=1 Tax=Furfurilactobacillus rossiae TaxID=231049 RepID=UPI003B97DC0E
MIVLSGAGYFGLKGIYSVLRKKPKYIHFFDGLNMLIIIFCQSIFAKYLTIPITTDDLRVKAQAYLLAFGDKKWPEYFHMFPNNVNVTIVYSWLIRIFQKISPHHVNDLIVIFLFLLMDIAILSSYRCIVLLTHRGSVGTLFLLVMIFFLPVYLYAFFFYTDPLMVVFPAIAFYFLLKSKLTKQTHTKWTMFVLSVISLGVGYVLKPNVVIIVVALIVFCFVSFFEDGSSAKKMLTLSIQIFILLFVFAGFKFSSNAMQSANGFNRSVQKEVPSSAFIYMSLDPNSSGQITGDLFKYQNIRSVREKKVSSNKDIKKRLNTLGVDGITNHWWKKLVHTFGSGVMGSDLPSLSAIGHVRVASHLHQILFWLANLNQVVYIIILFGIVFFAVSEFASPTDIGKKSLFAALSILGIISFHVLIWEAESRYSFIVMFFMIILGTIGLSKSFEKYDAVKLKALKAKTFCALSVCAIALVGFSTSQPLTKINNTESVITALQSGLSSSQDKQYVLSPKQTVEQRFSATNYFSTVSISSEVFNDPRVRVQIIDEEKHTSVTVKSNQFNSASSSVPINGHPGHFRIRITNMTNKTIKMSGLNYTPHFKASSGTNLEDDLHPGHSVPFNAYYDISTQLVNSWSLGLITIFSSLFILESIGFFKRRIDADSNL